VFSYGRLVHIGLQAYYSVALCQATEAACQAVSNAIEDDWGDEQLFILAEVFALLEAYAKHDPVAALTHHIEAVEEEFKVFLRSLASYQYSRYQLVGKKDLKTTDCHGNLWLWDHKTGSTKLNRDWLSLNDQMAFYLWSEIELGNHPIGIVYNLIRKPCIRPRKGEQPDEWQARLSEDIAFRSEFYFQHELIVKSPKMVEQTQQELWHLAHLVGKEPILRNPSACQFMGCAYREVCQIDSPLIRSTSYRIEEPHSELKEV